MSNEEGLAKKIGVAASIATLSVPFLYIFGYAYDQGYLRTYGISNEFFAKSIQEYLVLSFYALLGIAISLVDFANKYQGLFFVIGVFVSCLALAVVFVSRKGIDERIKAYAAKSRQHPLFDYIFFPLVTGMLAMSLPFVAIISIAMLLMVPAIAYFKGESVAKDEIQAAKACTGATSLEIGCVYLLENSKPIASGAFVARSSTHLALFNNGKTSIYPVKDQIVELMPKKSAPNPAVEGTLRDKAAQRPSP